MYRHILVPTDGSRVSERAAKAAIALARIHGARLTALHVVAAPAEPPFVMASQGRPNVGLAGSETLKVVAHGGIPVLAHHAA
jgi:nucleotide-binding universal stress UspA family protein